MSWFTKHRPTTISQLHLTTVRNKLQSLLTSPQFPQAFLFAGPKGTGKTSSSRIIAALLNDPANADVVNFLFFGGKQPTKIELKEPDVKNEIVMRIQKGNSLVVTEMDAASNRGIDDIRSLKERLALPPQEGKVAVYILDEAHMLTSEAFNALLKVLEEPPAHVVFILATTELHKIPETIVSRCYQVQFRKATKEELIEALESVAQKEKLASLPSEVLALLADQADGSFRDGVKLLEQVASSGLDLTLSAVEQQLTAGVDQSIAELINAVLDKDQTRIIEICDKLRSEGVNQASFHRSLIQYLHQQLAQSLGLTEGEAFASTKIIHFLLKEISQVDYQQSTPLALLPLELKLLDLIFRSQARSGGNDSGEKTVLAPLKKNELELKKPVLKAETVTISRFAALGNGQNLIDRWEEFLAQVKEKNSTIQALLRSAQPISGVEGKAQIAVFYQFHQEQLQQPKFLNLLEACSQEITGGKIELDFILSKPAPPTVTDPTNAEKELVDLAKSILV